jgi:hypothetical protein
MFIINLIIFNLSSCDVEVIVDRYRLGRNIKFNQNLLSLLCRVHEDAWTEKYVHLFYIFCIQQYKIYIVVTLVN